MSTPHGLTPHLRDAIALNTTRRWKYGRASNGRSLPLSTALIQSERSALLLGSWLDARARPWNEQGIPIVANDFSPMDNLPAWDSPPRWQGSSRPATRHQLRQDLKIFRRSTRRLARHHDLPSIVKSASQFLARLDDYEWTDRAHLAMSRHLVESIGFTAENAIAYCEQSGGGTNSLAADLLSIQALALRLAGPIDRQAQALHARGLGIIVNDVPAISFPTARHAV